MTRPRARGQLRTDEHAVRFAEVVSETLRGFVDLAFWAHLRLGELLALRIGDIDMDAGTVAVQRQVVETDAGPVEGHPRRVASASSISPRRASRHWPNT